MAKMTHAYDMSTKAWYCISCDTDCGRDDMPCTCCFEDLPEVIVYGPDPREHINLS